MQTSIREMVVERGRARLKGPNQGHTARPLIKKTLDHRQDSQSVLGSTPLLARPSTRIATMLTDKLEHRKLDLGRERPYLGCRIRF
jgi:hypothetical protein